ncbi:sensor histidine kinase [Halarcobacter bivalviorum]|uniref:sensor histidine kinase n=1 Tax=Halarcobacter bivalviorum TaxID=663364 RepID=UPI00100AAF39|nr:cache domain-containing protein [Halarcobacter bivalviorum]RXK06093.1 histidine kinase [Halarcobacter bivalviorum]
MNNKNELTILNIIKYGPILFILSLSIIISLTLYINYNSAFAEEKALIEKEFIQKNKNDIKNQVDLIYNFILEEQKTTEIKLKDNLRKRVYEAHSIAMNIYNENKHLGKEVVSKMIKDALRTIRFNNGRGYFFIYSFDYECILLPVAKQLEGTSFYNFTDGEGKYLTRNIIKTLEKENESFLKWWYHKPKDMKNQYEKIGFNKKFEPYNWYIGTGEYIEDFENDMKEDVLRHIQKQQFQKNDYIFIIDYNSTYLAHKNKALIGENALEIYDKKAYKIIEDIITIAKKEGSGFLSYEHIRPETSQFAKKTSYIRGLQNWQWALGVGFYEDDLNKKVEAQRKVLDKRFEDDLYRLLILSLSFTTILLILSIKISKYLETRFKQYQEQIKEHLEEITHQQNILAQQSKMAAIGTMIGNIAHQWRQPLSLISTAATGMKLKREIGDLSDKEFNDNLEYINQSTQYLSKTIDDFRNFFTSNKTKKEFSIDEAFENTFNLIKVQFKNHNIEVFKEIGNTEIYGIQTELVQVLINVLNNSRDELIKMPNNTRKLIFIKTFEKEQQLFIEITDNAGGIDKEVLEHVFEPYFTTKNQSQGTGIGLYMSQEIIVKHMHGTIEMYNASYNYDGEEYKGVKTIIKLNINK